MSEITIAGENIDWIKEYENFILDEVNTKKIILDNDTDSLFNLKVKINLRKMGPKLGKKINDYMSAAKNDNWILNDDKTLSILDHKLEKDEYILEKESKFGTDNREINNGKFIISLNLNIDTNLEIEGIARDILRAIQNARKEKNLDVSDKIVCNINGNEEIKKAVEIHEDYIKINSLAEKLTFCEVNSKEQIPISNNLYIKLDINTKN